MKKLLVIICLVFSATFMFAQEFNKWSIEPEFGFTKVRDYPKVRFGNGGLGIRYMVTPFFGTKLSVSYTETNLPIKYISGQFMGVCNFGRLAKLEQVANNRWTIFVGIGGDYTDSRGSTNNVFFHRISDFHLAGFVENEFKVTDKFFLTAGLNVVTGVNSRPEVTPYNRTMTTAIIDFNIKAIFVLGKKKVHADFYLKPDVVPETKIVYIDSTRHVTNNYYTDVCEEFSTSESHPEYIYFANDSYNIDKDGLENIEKSLLKIKDKVTITAYCSNVASSEYNLKLAKNRANAVKGKLVNLGVDPSKINLVSVGIDFDRKIPEMFDMARRVKIEF